MTTTDPKAPLPDDLSLERYGLQWNGPDTFVAQPMSDGYWTPWHIASAHIAELEATVLEREKELYAVGENRAHLERLSVGLISTNKVLEAENKRLREALYRYSQFDWSCVEKDVGHGPESLSWLADIANEALAQSDGKAGE